MFANFSLPDVATVSRRTVVGSLIIGVVGLLGSLLLSAPLIGLGLCIGLGIGIFNFRLIQRSVVKVGERQDENKRRPLAMNTLGRLSVISVIALSLFFVSFDLGLGVMVGLAAFQGFLLLNVARSMFKMGHLAAGDTGGGVIDADATDGPIAEGLPAPADLRDQQREGA